MKKITFFVFLLLATITYKLDAQSFYGSSSGEMILSFSNAAYHGSPYNPGETVSVSDAPRFTVWFHTSSYLNMDFGEHFGLYTGLGIRNIGFITKEKSSDITINENVKWKRRSYTLGIPFAFKIGNMNGFYFFAGGQYDWLFHYKEKEFLNSGKRKYSEWFSKRVNTFLPSVFVGFTLPSDLSIKFTYTLESFMNKDYSYVDHNGDLVKPYENMDSKIYYISVFYNAKWTNYIEKETTVKKVAVL